jgi:Dolichyl-phosphate-mannose-protein mannosyltransferase
VKAPARPAIRLLRRREAGFSVLWGIRPAGAVASAARRTGRYVADHRHAFILVGILALAALPRVWALGEVGFRGDEAVYAGQAGVLAGDHGLDRYFVLASRGNSNFLFYQEVVALVYFLFGLSDVSARLVSAGFSIATVLVCFELGRTLYSRNVGLLSAAFMALSGYGVLLGRLALLDSTLVFLFSLSVLFFAKWIVTERDRWLLAFAAALAWTIQAKVTGGLVLVIAVNYLLVSRQLGLLTMRRLLKAGLAFTIFFIPVLIQLALKGHQLLEFLSDSGDRVAHVPWYYYLDKLTSFEGFITPLIWLAGIMIAVRRWTTGDRLLIFWVLVAGLFFQFYPLKAFNYVLPLIPALSVLAGRAVHEGALALAAWWRRPHRVGSRLAPWAGRLAVALAVCAAFAGTAKPVLDAAKSDSYFGLREAAAWLKANTSPDAGVMTLSKGSAQYALSFYARRDAYPYGRFRLATIVPGGKVLNPSPASDGGPSTDWVSHWPPRLIKSREVSYLVYYTDEGDDPPENPLVDTAHQERFRRFIEAYGGKLKHVVYRNHEGRAWIYKVQKLLRRPRITFRSGARRLTVRGEGFRFHSTVALYYHQARRGTFKTDGDGAFTARIRLPYYVHHRYWLIATDNFGSYASTVGLDPTLRNRRARRRIASRVHANGGRIERAKQPRRPGTVLPGREPLKVDLKMPKAVQVGAALPVNIRVTTKRQGRVQAAAQSHLFFQIFSHDGRTPVRWRERQTNTLGKAYLQLATLELPGYYKLSVFASKDDHRGQITRTFKVRRR